jgi:hypothetical protein
MKKILALATFAAAMSLTSASAATIISSCVPAPQTLVGVSNSGTENCTIGALPGGATVNSITLQTTFDGVYDGFLTGGSISYTFNGPGTLDTAGTVIQGGPQDNKSTSACDAACSAAVLSGAFTVIDSYTGNGAAVTGATFNKRVTIDYTIQQTGVPEPSTFMMLGTALTALGAIARRRKA